LCVVIFSGTLDLNELIRSQAAHTPGYWFGIPGIDLAKSGGFFSWNIFLMPTFLPLFVIFFI